VHSEGSGQEVGEIAVAVTEQLPLVAVTTTFVPIGIFIIESPTIFPAEAEIVPLLSVNAISCSRTFSCCV